MLYIYSIIMFLFEYDIVHVCVCVYVNNIISDDTLIASWYFLIRYFYHYWIIINMFRYF